jgi:hypothetical protein
MTTSALRLLLGFLVAPGIPVFILYRINLQLVPRADAEFGAVIYLLLAYIATLIVGLPTCFLARRLRVSSLRGFTLLGALAGLAFHAIVLLSIAPPLSLPETERLVSISRSAAPGAIAAATCAAVTGALFWLIAIRPQGRGHL